MKTHASNRQPRRALWVWAAVLAIAVGSSAYASRARSAPALLGPLSTAARAHAAFDGRVVERLRAGSYTYLRVERANAASDWVVSLSATAGARAAAVGTRLHVSPVAYSERFASKRLDRVFDRLHFAMVRPLRTVNP